MATRTLTQRSYKPERVHDFIYDNDYVTCSERDHARATFKAHTSTDRIQRVPIYRTMFSELRHFPSHQTRLQAQNPVPEFMNKQWRGYANQRREELIRYTRFNYDPNVVVDPIHVPDPQVSGKNRYLYFKRPIMPYIQALPPSVILATGLQDPLQVMDRGAEQKRPLTPLTRVAVTQTDYRDSEVQTEPYTPEYVVRPGEQPELLTLASLSYGRGLPAGQAEVEMIERARIKRAWEKTLPPLNDMDQADKRRRMMDEMERHEWSVREAEIEKLQEERLEVLKRLLTQREENHQDINIKRLDSIWSKRQKVKDSKVRKIRKEHVKAIRKLVAQRQKVEGTYQRRDVIKQYALPESEVYAPLTRNGVFPDRNSERYVVKNQFLSSYNGLCELEASLPDFVLHPRIKAVKPQTVTRAGFIKRKYRHEMELADMHESLKAMHKEVQDEPKPLRFLVRVEKPIPRPPTPSIDVPLQEAEERELAIIYLQKILRGRAVQNMMYEGKEKRAELISEMRSTHALQEHEMNIKKHEMQTTLALQRQRHIHEHKEFLVDEALGRLEGETLADMLDFLCKELVRLQEERRIHAHLMLAERQRRIREAEESGRRQVEERRRREADEIFKQVVKVHQDSVETYLTDIILASTDRTAHEQAREEIEHKAQLINDIAYEVEETRTELESEEIVADLVHCFLLPEIQSLTMREQVHAKQRKYLLAAHREVYKDVAPVVDMHQVALVGVEPSELSEELIKKTDTEAEDSWMLVTVGGSVKSVCTEEGEGEEWSVADEKVEEEEKDVEQNKEEGVEQNEEEGVEQNEEEGAEQNEEEGAEQNEEEGAEQNEEEGAKQNEEEGAEHNVEEGAEHNVEEGAEHNVEEGAEHNVEEVAEHNVEEGAEHNVEESAEQNVEEGVEHNVEEGVEQIEEEKEDDVEQNEEKDEVNVEVNEEEQGCVEDILSKKTNEERSMEDTVQVEVNMVDVDEDDEARKEDTTSPGEEQDEE